LYLQGDLLNFSCLCILRSFKGTLNYQVCIASNGRMNSGA
jgi:hypothetical protein